MTGWVNRPLEGVYPVVFVDAIWSRSGDGLAEEYHEPPFPQVEPAEMAAIRRLVIVDERQLIVIVVIRVLRVQATVVHARRRRSRGRILMIET